MPKKFVGENSKAVVAKARKAAAKEEENFRKQKQIEDEYWKDDDKTLAKKLQKKEDKEKKRQELVQKKAESQALIEQELNSIKTAGKQPLSKVTRAEIQAETDRRNWVAQQKQKSPQTHLEHPIEENINRLTFEGEEARTVTEAISILSVNTPEVDRHPEKRLKAAFTAYEEANMPRIKEENPTLRLSQLKQILRKEWMKSPENPLNQALSK
uniref:Coiled-coil domain-containing protein n=1 Tax=Clastoptera arizonana TaxID=38151 RepID=A0A1B6ED03_9HEMI